jgi:hypothetical protein
MSGALGGVIVVIVIIAIVFIISVASDALGTLLAPIRQWCQDHSISIFLVSLVIAGGLIGWLLN